MITDSKNAVHNSPIGAMHKIKQFCNFFSNGMRTSTLIEETVEGKDKMDVPEAGIKKSLNHNQ